MSMITRVDKENKFVSMFNTETGFYVRTGIIDNGKDTGIDPFMASYPELIDVGIMGSCIHGKSGLCVKAGVECYQNGLGKTEPNMSLETFKKIVDQSKGNSFQFALGGRGDVNKHESFAEIMSYCRENGIAPNYTTSGLGLTKKEVEITKEFAGSVAVSFYRQSHTYRALQMFIDAGISTNIHYVLGNNSIDEAIERLKNNDFPKGINAVVFLLHKPVGLGSEANVLKVDDPKVAEFYSIIDQMNFDFQIGFDSCNMAGLVNFNKNINMDSTDACEASRYSCYITPDNKLLPCSFDNQKERWAIDLNTHSIEEGWNSDLFNQFRNHLRYSCGGCKQRELCMGGCPVVNQITLCNREEKNIFNV
jgi:radical SAM protein with 4Fe4S-binding SPASM domain